MSLRDQDGILKNLRGGLMERISLKADRFFSILSTILSTLNIDEILTIVVKEIQSILGADRCTLYLIDKGNNELYSKVLQANELVEIRLPFAKDSLAGYSAITGKVLNIRDAYDEREIMALDSELNFDKKWDRASGYRTKSVLVVPVPGAKTINAVGVFQAINKEGGFSETDVNTMEHLTYLLGIATNNAFLYQSIEEGKKLREYIIDDIEEGICILDTKKCIVSANRFLEVMSGMRYSIEAMIGKNFFDIFSNFVNTQLEEKINEALSQGFKKVALLEVLHVKIIPYLDEKGRVKRLILIFSGG